VLVSHEGDEQVRQWSGPALFNGLQGQAGFADATSAAQRDETDLGATQQGTDGVLVAANERSELAGRECLAACPDVAGEWEEGRNRVWPEEVWVRPASSKAKAKAWTLANRCAGSLARALSTTCSTPSGSVGTFSVKEGGGVSVCWTASSENVPQKGGWPQSHS
jgi:hypothetical protein